MNTENNTSTYNELEEMKSEMQRLRQSLQEQKIFSEQAIRNAMGERSRWISRLVSTELYIVIPLLILMFAGIKYFIGLSWPFVIVTCVLCIIDAFWDRSINRLKSADFATLSMVQLKERLDGQKKKRRRQMVIELPLMVLWCVWFAYDLTTNPVGIFRQMPASIWYCLLAVVAPLSIVAAMMLYRKMQATDSASIAELEKLKDPDSEEK